MDKEKKQFFANVTFGFVLGVCAAAAIFAVFPTVQVNESVQFSQVNSTGILELPTGNIPRYSPEFGVTCYGTPEGAHACTELPDWVKA
jgi:hypothetical protein